jgi:TRAP-type C4-dicarboxylate transport system permease small subunit
MVPLIFLTIAYVEKERSHIAPKFVQTKVPEKVGIIFNIVGRSIMLMIFLVFGWYSWLFAMKAMAIGEFVQEAYKIIVWPASFYIPIGCWALCLQLVVHLVEDGRALKEKL